MALNPSTNPTMSGRVTAVDSNYPYASAKDETSPGAGDGTPYFKARADDIFGLQQALLKAASIVPNGNADTVPISQYTQAIVELISGRAVNYDDSGAADAYVLDVQTNQYEPAALFDGLAVQFLPANTNTGASTVNIAGLGVINIKLPGGTTNPSAGMILAGRLAKLIYRTSPSAHAELDLSGTMQTTVIASSTTYNPPTGVKALRFIAIGGGGGSGGVDGSGAGTGASAAAGAGGGTAIKSTTQVEAAYTITVGAGGAGGAAGNNAGTAGGVTSVVSVGVNLTANGGAGGIGRTASAGVSLAGGATGGTATGGDRNITGGGTGIAGSTGGGGPLSGHPGGESYWGPGGEAVLGATAVSSGNPGAGGGSTSVFGVTTNYAGAAGGNGRVIVEEYF
jgi:hypothetical protein